jgi:hypothetical protein
MLVGIGEHDAGTDLVARRLAVIRKGGAWLSASAIDEAQPAARTRANKAQKYDYLRISPAGPTQSGPDELFGGDKR